MIWSIPTQIEFRFRGNFGVALLKRLAKGLEITVAQRAKDKKFLWFVNEVILPVAGVGRNGLKALFRLYYQGESLGSGLYPELGRNLMVGLHRSGPE